jgi:hypothetical protein
VLRFEKDVPSRFRKEDIVVRTVGELIDELAKLPRDLPLVGDMSNGMCKVSVTRIIAGRGKEWLACEVEGFDCDEFDDDDDEL